MTGTSKSDWYLREWMAHFGKRQAALVNELGWLKGRASKFWNGQIPYRREIVNELAAWLGIEPFELLMPPADALRLRNFRKMLREVAEQDAHYEPPPPADPKRTGTSG